MARRKRIVLTARADWNCAACQAINEDIPEAQTCWQCGTLRVKLRPFRERLRLGYMNYRRLGLGRFQAARIALRQASL